MNDSSRIFWRLDRGLEAEVLKEGEEEEDNLKRTWKRGLEEEI
jgi:hypothetical protein